MKNKFYNEFTVKMIIVAVKNKKEINKKEIRVQIKYFMRWLESNEK